MPYFTRAEDLEAELVATAERFLRSDPGPRPDVPTLLLRTVDPGVEITIDFANRRAAAGAGEEAGVVLEVEADALHDILLDRLDPVQISRLYETERVSFAGSPEQLAALILAAGRIQLHYGASLRERGRSDLLATPAPPSKVEWGEPERAQSPRPMLNQRRPWQRRKREARVN